MSLDRFLRGQEQSGDLDSSGEFTIDLQAAAYKLSRYRLPSENHHLVRLLQLALQLGAERVEMQVTMVSFTVSFTSSRSASDELHANLGQISAARSSPVKGESFSLPRWIAGLSFGVLELDWEMTVDGVQRVFRLKSGGPLESTGPALPGGEMHHVIRLVHSSSWAWRLWEVSRRRKKAQDLLLESTGITDRVVLLNGRSLVEPSNVIVLNDHVKDFGGSEFNAATGVMQNRRSPVATSNLLFQLASDEQSAVRVAPLPLVAYRVKKGFTVWDREASFRAGFGDYDERPDGVEVPSWVLQFVFDRENLTPGELPEGPRYRTIIAQNILGPGNSEGVRVTVVRHGVTILSTQEEPGTPGLEDLAGCSILFADEELDTDLSELVVVKNEKYYDRLRAFIPLVESGHRYFQEAVKLIKEGPV